jgi:hypothetical protein
LAGTLEDGEPNISLHRRRLLNEWKKAGKRNETSASSEIEKKRKSPPLPLSFLKREKLTTHNSPPRLRLSALKVALTI